MMPQPTMSSIVKKDVDRFVFRGSPSTGKVSRIYKILCYGDQNTVGYTVDGNSPYGESLAEALGGAGLSCEVTACGLCNFTSEDLANAIHAPYIEAGVGPSGKGLAHILGEDQFDLVIIMVGTNDLGRRLDPVMIQAFTTKLHSTCHVNGIPTVSILPPTVSPNSDNNMFKEVRAIRKRLIEGMSTWVGNCKHALLSLDCETTFRPGKAYSKSMTQSGKPDGICLSALGSKQLAQELALQLASVLGQLQQSRVEPVPSSQTCPKQVQQSSQVCNKSVGYMKSAQNQMFIEGTLIMLPASLRIVGS
jgi:lysophospholipase L1-like esterase